MAELSHSLAHIAQFDSRRVLEYSKEEGKQSLARALGCDAHCEVMIEHREPAREQMNGTDEHLDGDQTPRAASPHLGRPSEEDKIAVLEHYHADMARIRKSSSLLIFLLLPLTSATGQDRDATRRSPSSVVSELSIETVIQPFLLPGQEEFSSRVPGVKIVDGRSRAMTKEQAWSQAAQRVGALSTGWS